MGRLPRLPLMIFERTGVAGHQSLARDHVTYRDLATDRQQREYDIVQERHTLTVSRAERRKSALSDALRAVPKLFAVGGSEWVYNTTATIRQGAKTDMDAMPGADARRHVSVQRCKPCTKPHDHGDMPKYLSSGLTQYALNNFTNNLPPVPRCSRRRFDSS